MSLIDWVVLVVTFILIISYGLYKSNATKNLEGYFLSNRSMPWYLVLLGIMGTQASAITFLSAPGQAYTDGMRFVQYYFGLPLAMIVIVVWFVPVFSKLKIFTAYEFLEQRFDLKTRTFTSFLFLLSRGLSTGISIYAPSIILSSLLGWDIFYTNMVMGGLLIIYTVSGGAKAVAYTQKLQLIIIFIGMIMVASASIPEGIAIADDPMMFVKRHGVFVVAAIALGAVVLMLPMEFWQRNSGRFLLLAIVMLIAVLVVGRSVNGAVRWIGFGPINIQPAEFAKFALFAYLASYLVRRQQEVQETLKGFFKPLLILFVLATLLLAQPDLGSVVVLMVTTIGLLFLAGAKLGQFIAILVTGISAVVLLIIVEPYRMRRVTSFLDPWQDPFGSGYQLTQSLMAFGRGGWFGQGLGNSVQKLEYLPEAHTDFLLAVIGEEFGFVGVVLIIGLFMWLTRRIMYIGRQAIAMDRVFAGLVAQGVGIWVGFQSFINIGVNLGALPTKGLTLPLMSYGGSAILLNLVAIAVVLRVDFENRVLMHGGRL